MLLPSLIFTLFTGIVVAQPIDLIDRNARGVPRDLKHKTCAPVPLNCTQPTFHIQIANGTAAGSYVYIPTSPESTYVYAQSSTNKTLATTFTVDPSGILFSATYNNQVFFYHPQGLDAGLVVFLSPTEKTSRYPVSQLHAQLGCGPECPKRASGTTGTLSSSGNLGNMIDFTFAYCNGAPEVTTVDGQHPFCSESGDVFYVAKFNSIII
ncbi:hypothetical protein TruAng_005607 [Truncatella angustata]|nr:hypothetical protein TruAng_005607 [Truncatella angustata]